LAVVTISLFSYFPFLFNDMTVIALPYLALLLAVILVLVLVDLLKDLYPTPQPSSSEADASPAAGEAVQKTREDGPFLPFKTDPKTAPLI
jgi:hypothetical protein